MKKLFLISAAILCFAAVGYGQNAPKYCELFVYGQSFSSNYIAELHIDSNYVKEQKPLRDANGKKMKFASEVAALNYIVKQGWDLVTTFQNKEGTHFVLTRGKKE